MKKNFIFLTLAVLGWSCKKDSDSNPNPTPTSSACLLTEIRDSVGNELSQSFEYDASRKISKQSFYTNGNKTGYATFTFSGSTMTIQNYKLNNTIDGSPAIATLNSSGNITKIIFGSRPDTVNGTPGTAKDTSDYTYNNSSQLFKMSIRSWIRDASGNILSSYSSSSEYEYSNGQVTKETNKYESSFGNNTNTTTYTYNNSSPVVTSNPVIDDYGLPGTELFGKLMSNRIPVKSETSTGTSTFTTTYNATVDAKGNPTKLREASEFFTNTSLYNYNCP